MEFTNFADPDNPTVSPITADVSFKATTQPITTSTKSKFRSEDVRFVSSQFTKKRSASVGGTVTLGAQKILSPDIASFSATIGSVVSKEKTVARPLN